MKPNIRNLNRWARTFAYIHDFRVTAMIGLTYFCQMSCPHCSMANYVKNKKEELSTDELMEIINRFPKSKIKGVYFFGGEPLLRNDVFELIKCAHKKRFATLLDSNGYLLTKEVAKKLKDAGLRIIGISIDNSDPQIHNRLRGKEDSFERAVEGIKNCLNEKINVYLDTYATKENLKNGDLKKIVSLGEKLGVSYVRILSPLPMGKWLGREDIKLNDQENQLLQTFHQFGFVYLEGDHCSPIRKRLFYMSPYGEVQPCCNIPFTFGNIRDEPLEKILKRMWKHPMFKMKIKECPVVNEKFQKKYFSKLTSSTKLPLDLS